MKNGCTKCAIPTQFIVLRRCSIRMDVGNKIFSNAFEPSATISGFSWQNEATNSSRPNHQKERRPKFAIRLVVASCLRSEEHTSELQSRFDLVCRLLLEKKKLKSKIIIETFSRLLRKNN